MRVLYYIGIIAVLMFVLLRVGTDDFKNEQELLHTYCARVAAGIWPDYKEIYDKECKKPLPPSNLTVTIDRH